MCIASDHAGQSEAHWQCLALRLYDTSHLVGDPLECAGIAVWPDRQGIVRSPPPPYNARNPNIPSDKRADDNYIVFPISFHLSSPSVTA